MSSRAGPSPPASPRRERELRRCSGQLGSHRTQGAVLGCCRFHRRTPIPRSLPRDRCASGPLPRAGGAGPWPAGARWARPRPAVAIPTRWDGRAPREGASKALNFPPPRLKVVSDEKPDHPTLPASTTRRPRRGSGAIGSTPTVDRGDFADGRTRLAITRAHKYIAPADKPADVDRSRPKFLLRGRLLAPPAAQGNSPAAVSGQPFHQCPSPQAALGQKPIQRRTAGGNWLADRLPHSSREAISCCKLASREAS